MVAAEGFEPTTSGVELRDSLFSGRDAAATSSAVHQSIGPRIGPRRSNAQRIAAVENPKNRCVHERKDWWTHLDSNQGPLACETINANRLSSRMDQLETNRRRPPFDGTEVSRLN